VEQVGVDIHYAGRDVKTADVDCLAGTRRVDGGGDFSDLSRLDCHIARAIDIIPGIDDVAAFEQQIVLGEGGGEQKDRGEKFEHELFEQFLDGQIEIGTPGVKSRLHFVSVFQTVGVTVPDAGVNHPNKRYAKTSVIVELLL